MNAECNMEEKLKSYLKVSSLRKIGSSSGCINEGYSYQTENGDIFVKRNCKPKAKEMFDGELESLKTILSTDTVRVPKPMTVLKEGCESALVMEHIDMSSLRSHSAKLGELLAKMHLHNQSHKEKDYSSIHNNTENEYIENFGFHVTTCCGYLPMENAWKSNWVEFYAQQRLGSQLKLVASEYGDREAAELWSQLQLKLPLFFEDVTVIPALLHGDLWSGNVAETKEEPVIFDPATFYGHSEYELAIAGMFGGFSNAFYNAYHNLLPKQNGFEKRNKLYQLFHYLNHWNHFGGGYRGSSISIMRQLLKD